MSLEILIALVVLNTAIWTLFDASRIRDAHHTGVGPRNVPPHAWAALVTLFWPIAFPAYVFSVRRAGQSAPPRSGPPPTFEAKKLNVWGFFALIVFLALGAWLLFSGYPRWAGLAGFAMVVGVFGGRSARQLEGEQRSFDLGGAAWDMTGFRPLDDELADDGPPVDDVRFAGGTNLPPIADRFGNVHQGVLGAAGTAQVQASAPGQIDVFAPPQSAPLPSSSDAPSPETAAALPAPPSAPAAPPATQMPQAPPPQVPALTPVQSQPLQPQPAQPPPVPTRSSELLDPSVGVFDSDLASLDDDVARPDDVGLDRMAAPLPPPGTQAPALRTRTAPRATVADPADELSYFVTADAEPEPAHEHAAPAPAAPSAPLAPPPSPPAAAQAAPSALPSATPPVARQVSAQEARGVPMPPPGTPLPAGPIPKGSMLPAPRPAPEQARMTAAEIDSLAPPEPASGSVSAPPQAAVAAQSAAGHPSAPSAPSAPSPPSQPIQSPAHAPQPPVAGSTAPRPPQAPRPSTAPRPSASGRPPGVAGVGGYGAAAASSAGGGVPAPLLWLLGIALVCAGAWLWSRMDSEDAPLDPAQTETVPAPTATSTRPQDAAATPTADRTDPGELIRRRMSDWIQTYDATMSPIADLIEEIDFDKLGGSRCIELQRLLRGAQREIDAAPDPEIRDLFTGALPALLEAADACQRKDEIRWSVQLLQGKGHTHETQLLLDERYRYTGPFELELEEAIGQARSTESISGKYQAGMLEGEPEAID